MSKFADQLRELKLYNNYDLLKRFGKSGDVAVEYISGDALHVHHTVVWSPYPCPNLPPSKRFGYTPRKEFTGKRVNTFPLALSWAKERFGHDYAPSPFGGHLPTHILDRAKAALRSASAPHSAAD